MLRRVLGSLFSKTEPARQPIGDNSAAAPPPAGASHAKPQSPWVDMAALIEHAATRVCDDLSAATASYVESLAGRFELPDASATADLHVFVFHVDMGAAAGKVEFRDVTMDVGWFDYVSILQTFKQCVVRWHPQAVLFLVTSPGSPLIALADDRTRVVELDIPSDQTMYQRVAAMCAYSRSAAFVRDTLFLDSDAFLNARFTEYLNADYDVAVTVREDTGLMPVNEGVIVARAERRAAVRGFFDRYLATYDALLCDERIAEYGDVRKWRGGQLSLNAATRVAHPYSNQRRISVGDARLQCLPCDPFNYSYKYGADVAQERLGSKVVVHLKGGRKSDLKAALASIHAEQGKEYIEPMFATWNKEYREHPFADKAINSNFLGAIQTAAAIAGANAASGNAVLVDDLFTWFRAVHFLKDPSFVAAMGPLKGDPILRARIWRVYTLCWAAKSCLSLDGDFVDIGCYDGKTVAVIDRYCRFSQQQEKRYWLFDMFENPPLESRKSGHGPDLFEKVRAMFPDASRYAVIKGPVPDSFDGNLPEKIAFAQIDLNAAEPELAALERTFERIVPGGMIVFDDFGFSRYSRTRELEAEFMSRRGLTIFECPTGQGIFIKR